MEGGLHHLLARKKGLTTLESYPHPNRSMRVFDKFMYIIALLAPLALLPQVFHLFEYKSVDGLSLTTWFLLGSMNMFWSMYGILHKEWQIFISNILVGLLSYVVVIGILLY